MIDRVLQEAINALARQTPWTSLQGPGVIWVATLHSIGWSFESPTGWHAATSGPRLGLAAGV
eukprot:330756-Pyramimonas_sp.AAC.1